MADQTPTPQPTRHWIETAATRYGIEHVLVCESPETCTTTAVHPPLGKETGQHPGHCDVSEWVSNESVDELMAWPEGRRDVIGRVEVSVSYSGFEGEDGPSLEPVPVGGQPQPGLLHEQIHAALAERGLIAPTGQVPYWSERLGCIAWQPANEYALALAGTTLEQPEPEPRPDTPTDPQPTLHDAIARGIDRAIRDAGATLTGCTPSMMTGHVIREIRAAGLHPAQHVPADVACAAELIHQDIGAAMEVLYGEIGGKGDTVDDVAATSKRIADDMRRVLAWVLAGVRGEPQTFRSEPANLNLSGEGSGRGEPHTTPGDGDLIERAQRRVGVITGSLRAARSELESLASNLDRLKTDLDRAEGGGRR